MEEERRFGSSKIMMVLGYLRVKLNELCCNKTYFRNMIEIKDGHSCIVEVSGL
jgi:hypothetical protein